MSMTAPNSGRPSRFRRFLTIGTITLVTVIAVYVGLFFYGRDQDERRMREAIETVNRSDSDWTLEAIEAKRVVLTDDRNSAVQIMRIKPLLPKPWPPQPAASPATPAVPAPPA